MYIYIYTHTHSFFFPGTAFHSKKRYSLKLAGDANESQTPSLLNSIFLVMCDFAPV